MNSLIEKGRELLRKAPYWLLAGYVSAGSFGAWKYNTVRDISLKKTEILENKDAYIRHLITTTVPMKAGITVEHVEQLEQDLIRLETALGQLQRGNLDKADLIEQLRMELENVKAGAEVRLRGASTQD